ncbi:hypothetical protein ABH09_08965 [Treponema sp. OMZ 803]|uniref:hypothetical protein n=1 Tax=Treponema sp. OMZ 803 TaxID=120682 RepID=UPI0020A24066|nr:hypothetical protein [Treponema sp. OMZ 803]UTC52476.1 hypothetical protein ABH09_08965 [Treponema sp. OMZ 803]
MKRKNVSIIGAFVALIGMVFFMSSCKGQADETEPVYKRTDMTFELENKSGVQCSVVVSIIASNSISNDSKLAKEDTATSGVISLNVGEKKTVTINGILLSGTTNKSSRDYIHLIKIVASDGGAHFPSDYTSGWLQKGDLKTFDNAHFDIKITSAKFDIIKH